MFRGWRGVNALDIPAGVKLNELAKQILKLLPLLLLLLLLYVLYHVLTQGRVCRKYISRSSSRSSRGSSINILLWQFIQLSIHPTPLGSHRPDGVSE